MIDQKYSDPEERTLDQINEASENIDYWCVNCIHMRDMVFCDAFPDGIPSPILGGQVRHTKRMFGQKNDIVFERIEEINKKED